MRDVSWDGKKVGARENKSGGELSSRGPGTVKREPKEIDQRG